MLVSELGIELWKFIYEGIFFKSFIDGYKCLNGGKRRLNILRIFYKYNKYSLWREGRKLIFFDIYYRLSFLLNILYDILVNYLLDLWDGC